MSDMRGTGVRDMEPTSSTSKALAAFIVAIGVGAAGAYVYTSNGGLSQKEQPQQVAMNSDDAAVRPLTPPPAQTAVPQTAVPTTPQAGKPSAPDVTPPAQSTAASATPKGATPAPQRVARVKSRAAPSEQSAPTPPDVTQVPDNPAPTQVPASAEPAPPAPQPDPSQQPQTDQGASPQ
jgi:hypothetical protein